MGGVTVAPRVLLEQPQEEPFIATSPNDPPVTPPGLWEQLVFRWALAAPGVCWCPWCQYSCQGQVQGANQGSGGEDLCKSLLPLGVGAAFSVKGNTGPATGAASRYREPDSGMLAKKTRREMQKHRVPTGGLWARRLSRTRFCSQRQRGGDRPCDCRGRGRGWGSFLEEVMAGRQPALEEGPWEKPSSTGPLLLETFSGPTSSRFSPFLADHSSASFTGWFFPA